MEILSASASDTAAGIGAQQVTIEGVDGDRNILTETVTLNGTSVVAVPSTWFGVNRAKVIAAGSSKYNVGIITIRHSGGGATEAIIPAQVSITQQLIFHVPITTRAYIYRMNFEGANAAAGTPVFTINGYYEKDGVRINFYRTIFDTAVANNQLLRLTTPILIPEGSVWYINVLSSTNNEAISGRVDQTLITI